MRKIITQKINSSEILIKNLLAYFSDQSDICLLNSNHYNYDKYKLYDFIFATLPSKTITIHVNSKTKSGFQQLKQFYHETKDWLFGHFSYDLKNDLERLYSDNDDKINAPYLHFFQPGILFLIKNEVLTISYMPEIINETQIKKILYFAQETFNYSQPKKAEHIHVQSKISKDTYLKTVRKIKDHIQQGDIYELNYCQEFFATTVDINPQEVYWELNKVSPTPFSCYYKNNLIHLMCASPERFVKKEGGKIISQPIKGTIKRGNTSEEDAHFMQELQQSEKDRSENVMIVDLVRNDLSKTSKKGRVLVEELYGVYAFEQVFQMISTISSEIDAERFHPLDAIKHCFPMGSMTGAPKIKAMELIEKYETSKRGIYSGSVGYISPDGDFDFNVIIRSILYNSKNQYLSYMVGGAITIESDPLKEYDECMIKAKAINTVLGMK